jgi:hypothetical protein
MPRRTKKTTPPAPEKSHVERINRAKLEYLMKHYERLVAPLVAGSGKAERYKEGTDTSPRVLCARYLARCSKDGTLRVQYTQSGNGRWHARQSVSLQAMMRQVRHTVAGDLYKDVDMKNAHIAILLYMLKKSPLKRSQYSAIAEYAKNPDPMRKQLMEAAGYTRDQAKVVWLSKLNGGCAAYEQALKAIRANGAEVPPSLTKFARQMRAIHAHFAEVGRQTRPEEYTQNVERRRASGRDWNHDAAWLNLLLLEHENALLMEVVKELGGGDAPLNCVLCFDGVMVEKNVDVRPRRLKACERACKRATGIDIKLAVKPMNEAIVLPDDWEQDLAQPPPETYFNHFVQLLASKPEFTEEEILNWARPNIVALTRLGQGRIAVRGIEVVWDGDWCEEYVEWKGRTQKELFRETLDRKCLVLQSGGGGHWRQGLKPPLLGTYLQNEFYMNNKITTRRGMKCIPYLKDPPAHMNGGQYINAWGGFPVLRMKVSEPLDFTRSPLYRHWRDHFFRTPEELEHFLASIADMVQHPGRRPTNCVRVFYGTQGGTGKGASAHFMAHLLGTRNVCTIDDTEAFLRNEFNSDFCNKILRVFEELKKGNQYAKNIDKLKSVWEAKRERVRALYKDGEEQTAFSRTWKFTNHLPTWVSSGAVARRCSVHHVKDEKANVPGGYWTEIWNSLDDPAMMVGAFHFFATYKYDESLIRMACDTQLKRDMLRRSIGSGIDFLIKAFDTSTIRGCVVALNPTAQERVPEGEMVLGLQELNEAYRIFCAEGNIAWYGRSLGTQLERTADFPKTVKMKLVTGEARNVYQVDPARVERALRRSLGDPEFVLVRGE